MPNLTASQWDDLIEQYVELITDSMDTKTMYHFIVNTLTEDYHNLSEEELFTEIECTYDKETLDELVDTVTTVTYGLKEGETLSFPVHKKSSWPVMPIHRVSTILPMVGIFVYYKDMNKSNLQEFFPSLLQKGYSVREINESCKRHQERVAPDWFNGTYQEYLDEMHDFLNGI